MDDSQIVTLLRIAKNQKNVAHKNKNAVNNEINGLRLALDEMIDTDDDINEMRALKSQRKTKESYRSQLTGTINRLDGSMDDILYGKGDYNQAQLTFFDDQGNQVATPEEEEIEPTPPEQEQTA